MTGRKSIPQRRTWIGCIYCPSANAQRAVENQPCCCGSGVARRPDQTETAAAIRRTVEALLERGAVVRNLENLGERTLPYKMSKHNQRHSSGGYFLVDFDAPTTIIPAMLDHLGRDIDVIRPTILKHHTPVTDETCPGLVQPNYEEKLHSKRK
ncbi:28S ribosomal protein S6, mitochondrial isoform X2 [Stegostoma tigrinum]|uniref:28S ribosomal protein S6, mitochondrial isoform X2 n=1 Tax=Stegostoma tigrinum TaxID=3053191 RepID=UPI00286FFD38|nr:28S ribosomal protein S6, mitochondrial isoform X2 [Stegostoma tigrinum]